MVAAALVVDATSHHGRSRFFEDESDWSGDVLDGFVGGVTTIAQSQCQRWEATPTSRF
ncbi:transposase IS4 family protein [Natrialba asiatica DSM 12278]|uniref:Transposase IS4 family protein n=1 Tax=Natrialba asiatica (strain ATCC 700177 / DSM 12278 / JCM 9576 / FERM P-10747 / NBRC 102637 / 172P1) TaxID=29540 RepID=M0B2H9_NATA1|nr:transposase IS4 family protein [Natrialba asiatica DSM 12278]